MKFIKFVEREEGREGGGGGGNENVGKEMCLGNRFC